MDAWPEFQPKRWSRLLLSLGVFSFSLTAASEDSWAALRNVDVGNNPGGSTAPSPDAQKLQQALNDAALQGPGAVVTVDAAGDYRFGNSSLTLAGATGVTVVADPGATLWFNYTQGFVCSGCVNVSITGLVIDYDPPCFAQGVVSAVGPDPQRGLNSSQFEAVFDPRFIFPDPNVSPAFVNPGGVMGAKVGFWDPESLQQQYQGNQFLAHAEAIPDLRRKTSKHVKMVSQGFARYSWPRGADVSLLAAATAAASAVSYRLTLRSPVQGSPIVNKTLVAAWPRAGSTYLLHNSTGVITSNLTIHGGGNMAVVEDHGGGSHVHENLSIVRRQQDPVHLLANNADGFHSNTAAVGPRLLNSEISHTGDDHYNCHNRMLVALQVLDDGRSAYIIETDNGLTMNRLVQWMDRGDLYQRLQFYHLNTNALVASPTVVAAEQIFDPKVLALAANAYDKMQAPPNNAHLVRPFPADNVWLVNFSIQSPLPSSQALGNFSLINYDAASNAGAIVRGCHFHDGYSRVMLLKSINSTAQANLFERASGVHIESEQAWLEGSLGVRNVLVADNVLRDCSLTVGPSTSNITLRNNTCTPQPCDRHLAE